MKAFSFLIALLLTGYASAIDSFDEHCANIALLQDKRVQTEVGITTPQRNQMNKLADANRAKLAAYQKRLAGKQPDMSVLEGYMNGLKSSILGIMSTAQVKRLRELNLQAAGLIGLLDKVVAMKIGMTEAQFAKFNKTYSEGKTRADNVFKSQIQPALRPIDQKYQKLAAPYKGHEKEHIPELKKLTQEYQVEVRDLQKRFKPRLDAITLDTQKKLDSLVTPKERATWIGLQGKKFVPPKK